ncbi:type VI secretion system protein TssA [Pseudorhodobacter sp.]|uniref:type VI secretion system protein TssA n=1 Tax=Pseudorhodobacter sp. TaxID=1934400 RepID=UPI0026479FF6|nr:type VI secretion system protein TssA [Pseudorhodobacter sp.]MDN5787187.1 type VI secretion system protein TssA [Pseudorhodobacter sp.]
MDLSEFLNSHGDDAPSGENLEYDPAFISLELAAQPGEERQVGESIIAAEEPEYAEVIARAKEVLGRSHDLRAGVLLAHALLRTEGFSGFAQAMAYLRGCLDQWWDTCHPQLDADDDNDPTMRVNAVAALVDADTILRAVRLAPLTESRSFGRISLRDIAIATGEAAAPEGTETVADSGAISAAFKDTGAEKMGALRESVQSALDDLKTINAAFDDHIPGQGPELGALEKLLKQAAARIAEYGFGEVVGAADDAAGNGDAGAASAPAVVSSGGGGAINSPQDVRNTLDRLIAYYNRTEPSSPLPLLLERAKRLVGADFVTIVRDMARDGYSNVKTIGGLPDDDY